ncbi:histidine kinase dimerization/phosphoacceptor domain -containing protein [Hansschlegelia sp. KR7-227]|uniref:histidine kinase dimerization/phosphoacceptor domain -containing protein n=1 Tax=Hansschlegelia sp. KR7-227 TaxID=3400914 RepID=UPI003C083F05
MDTLDLTACDREPIHAPGAIQPHGVLLVADPDSLSLVAAAGDVEGRLGADVWLGRPLGELVGGAVLDRVRDIAADAPGPAYLGAVQAPSGEVFDASAHRSGGSLLVELEPASPEARSSGVLLSELEAAAAAFERAPTLEALCAVAAAEIRRITGYDRVMIYQFLADDSGAVIAEDRRQDLRSFLHHRFPASDVPKQARALYLRNPIRVIPDVGYQPAPIRPAGAGTYAIDLSDAALRSVSPIHLQYLRNMGIAASASVSIVHDGVLWGLVACHNETPRALAYDVRGAARAVTGQLGRQIRVKDETDAVRERVRLRSFQDDLVALLSREGSLDDAISNHVGEVRRAFGGDGVAILRGRDLVTSGRCPPDDAVRAIAAWALPRSVETVFATERLSERLPAAEAHRALASGLLAITLSLGDPWIAMWFRAEQVEVVEWAGNPHKGVEATPDQILTPRASFESWRETVSGRARRWTAPEIEAAGRLRSAVVEVWQTRRLQELNRRLVATIDEKDLLIQQKEFLIGEVNHRVQNSLQLVSSFLALQARASQSPGLAPALEEARRRLSAVALVHRRLYRSDQVEQIDAARYIEDLVADICASTGEEHARLIALDLSPVLVPTEHAISLGLVLTELMINAAKYAYGGEAGPIAIALSDHRGSIRLTVSDSGVGRASDAKKGFGSRMVEALVRQLSGELSYQDNRPGLRVTLSAPITRGRAGLSAEGV